MEVVEPGMFDLSEIRFNVLWMIFRHESGRLESVKLVGALDIFSQPKTTMEVP